MPYFHQSICISPQATYPETNMWDVLESNDNILAVVEPAYPGIPAGMRRRMGKNVRMAVGAAVQLLGKNEVPDGIVIATANGGMEDCIKFLNQILEYNEGLLTPGNFVQSTSNAAAAQIALVTKNHNYNITHVHRGLAFENAMLDVVMLLKENKNAGYLLGCTDEISAYNYNIDRLAGWFRDEPVLNTELFLNPAKGTIAGEGAFMAWVNNEREDATAELKAVRTIHSNELPVMLNALNKFLSDYFTEDGVPDLLLTGENGDDRLLPFYESVESYFKNVPVGRFKHLCGEYCTASSFAVWMAIQILQTGKVPATIDKKNNSEKPVKNILIYNNYRGIQHSFILMSGVFD